ncbi:acyl carrier protein [Candidatus Liberibacter brunswickensis]|uniref:acyl carrier protein n=1 Tax=Candidatus Liberibacter brunswickensis TaxID=1968796 RepID=UPI002FDFD0D1
MSNTNEDISNAVKEIIVSHLGVEMEQVKESARFIEDLGADSLDTVELVMSFEEKFSIEIPEDSAKNILTVGSAIDFIKNSKKNN